MNTHVMIDLETLGQRPGAVITSLGAVKFTADKIGEEFYERIDPQSCIDVGLKMDASTVLWWMKQDEAARAEFTKTTFEVMRVLLAFSDWLASDPDVRVWGCGASFDGVLLGSAYDACRLQRPWKFWNERCYRTLKALHPGVAIEPAGVKHNALDDAKAQARHLIRILNQSAGLVLS